MLVERLRRVLRYPDHELANLQDRRAWHAARNKNPARRSAHRARGNAMDPVKKDRLLKSLLWLMLVGLVSFLIGLLERP